MLKDAVIKMRREAPASVPQSPPKTHPRGVVGKEKEVLGEAGNGKGRPGKAFSSCHPASLENAGISKEDRTLRGGDPSEPRGPPVLKVQRRAYFKEEMLWM